METLRGHRSPAVLMQNHGPFTIGKDARDAVKAAVMVEDVARTVHLARQLGEPLPDPAGAIDSLYDRYQNVYGPGHRRPPRPRGAATHDFRGDTMPAPSTPPSSYEVWFLTGSQNLYGEDVLPGRRAVAGDRRAARRLLRRAGEGRLEARAHGLRQHPPPRARGERATTT